MQQRKLIHVILHAIILSLTNLPTFLCQCSDDAFNCGSIAYLAYPFWGGSRPRSCGKGGYQIKCQEGVPILNISSLSYRVLELDFNTNTIKLSRQDLWNSRCPEHLLNTTIDFNLFKYPKTPTDQNLTLYYHCTDEQPKLPNQFSCGGDQTANFFKTAGDDVSSAPGPDITCKDSIFVPINNDSAQSLQYPTASSVNVLQAALNSGFSILWPYYPLQVDPSVCNRNIPGSCICNRNRYASCIRTATKTYNASAPERHQGMPPVQTAPSPNDHQTEAPYTYGMPPPQTPDHAPHTRSINYYPPTKKGSNPRKWRTNSTLNLLITRSSGFLVPAPPQTPDDAPHTRSNNYYPPAINGMPPAQTPDHAPAPHTRSINYYPPTKNGMPPAQTPDHAPAPHTRSINYYPPTKNGSNPRKWRTNSRTSPTKKVVIVVLICMASVVIASLIMFFIVKRRHSANGLINKECNQYVEKFLVQHGSLAPRRYKYSQIKKITKSFSDKLGKGGYGSVYKGVLADGSLVAVKVLTETDSNGEEFINEVASISRTSHVNIVTLLGFCYEGSKRALVYEFMPNQSLDKFLNNKGDTDSCLNLEKLFEISVGIAKGLEYLHTGCSTRIVHFDIKPQNILLDEDFCPKISDFGLAKLCKKKQSVLSVLGTRGTVGYIAPEVFSRNFGSVSHKSDVYSYGMMVLEMVGAKDVVETPEVAPSSENYFPDKIYEQEILDVTNKVGDLMIEEEEETRRKMFLIGFWCIQTLPSDRPQMSKVVEMLEGSLQSIQIPPKPFLFTPNLPNQDFSSTFSAHVETQNSAED